MRHLRLFAREELVLALRSRWTQIFAVVFGVLSFAVAGAGYVALRRPRRPGLRAHRRLARAARAPPRAPHRARDRRPVPRPRAGSGGARVLAAGLAADDLLGKLLGLFQALAAAQAVGFGAVAAACTVGLGSEGLGEIFSLVAGSLVTTAGSPPRRRRRRCACGRKRTRALALASWAGSSRRAPPPGRLGWVARTSGTASRVLVVSTIVKWLALSGWGRSWHRRHPPRSAPPRRPSPLHEGGLWRGPRARPVAPRLVAPRPSACAACGKADVRPPGGGPAAALRSHHPARPDGQRGTSQ